MSTRVCVYHSRDLDGKCSAAIVRRLYSDVEMYPYDYGQPFDFERVRGKEVFMVDVSLQPFDQMLALSKICHLVWIDHHKTAIEAHEKSREHILGHREIGKAACELTWEEMFDGDTPLAVRLLGRYDVWDQSNRPAWESRILPFQYGMRLYDHEPGDIIWLNIINIPSLVTDIIETGKKILEYENRNNEYLCKSAYETEAFGLRLLCLNRRPGGSQLFTSRWDPARHQAMCSYGFDGEQWYISLYTDRNDVDVGAIAKTYGGGGHKQAAGFQLKILPCALGGVP